MVEEKEKPVNEGASLPFSPTISTTQYLLLTKMNNMSNAVWFIASMICVFLMTSLILFMGVQEIDLSVMFFFAFSLISAIMAFIFFGIISFYFPVVVKIRKSMLPQWALLFLELWPKQAGCDDKQDLYVRLRYIFGASMPKMDNPQKEERIDMSSYKAVFDRKLTFGKKQEYPVDIKDLFFNSNNFIIYFMVIFCIFTVFYLLTEATIYFYFITDPTIILFLYTIVALGIIAYFVIIYHSFFTRNLIIVKYFKPDATKDQLIEFRNAIVQSLPRRAIINLAGIVIDGDVSSSLLEWVQSEENRLPGDTKITLIQKKPTGFKLVWMG